MNKKGFMSDNCATVHPKVMQKLNEINSGHVRSYGEEEYSESVARRVAAECGGGEAILVASGTGANVVCLNALCPTWGAVICTDIAHINVDETGAPEHLIGAKLVAVRGGSDNKLTPELIAPKLNMLGVQHNSQPAVISITESSEVGTLYTVDEVKALADFAHENGLKLHMDGARIANAAVSLGCSVKELTKDAGVDALSFGFSKNGGMIGDAAVFFEHTPQAVYVRKSCTQLVSKLRFVAAQMDALLTDGLYLECARHANAMAKRLSDGMCTLPGVTAAWKTQANEVFLRLPHDIIEPLRAYTDFYDADEGVDTVRLVASHDTTVEEVDGFIAKAKELIG